MSKRAEEQALKAYPHYTAENLDDVIKARKFFAKGYEQAEKDLAFVAQFSSGLDGFFYGKGYQQAKKDFGWISVKDSLPEEGHFVLTCVSDSGTPQCVGMALLLKDGTWWDGDMKVNVDYWMEVPKLKK